VESQKYSREAKETKQQLKSKIKVKKEKKWKTTHANYGLPHYNRDNGE
jgi:hypothetical protein